MAKPKRESIIPKIVMLNYVQFKKWQPTPIFLPGESHGQRSLAGYSPWGCRESDTIEQLNNKNKTEKYSKLDSCDGAK